MFRRRPGQPQLVVIEGKKREGLPQGELHAPPTVEEWREDMRSSEVGMPKWVIDAVLAAKNK